jgi:hypothetical protein
MVRTIVMIFFCGFRVVPTVRVLSQISDSDAGAFGIAYKPYKKKDLGYEMPKIATFDDEKEFQLEMEQNSYLIEASKAISENNSFADMDNEFDFDADVPQGASSSAIADVLKRAADREIEPIHTSDSEQAKKSEVIVPIIEDLTTAKFDVRKAAKDAFSDLSSVYSSGLGDAEVRLLDSAIGAPPPLPQGKGQPASKQLVKSALTVTATIEEGDEEEEAETEQREQEEQLVKQRQVSSLEAEWEALGGATGDEDGGAASNSGFSNPIGAAAERPAGDAIEIITFDESLDYLRYLYE